MYGDTTGTFCSAQTPAYLYCARENRESGFCKGEALEECGETGLGADPGARYVGAPS